jgi:hypothetical protein
VEAETADAIVEDNEQSRLDCLRVSFSILALVALVALFFSSRIPTRETRLGALTLRCSAILRD